MPAILPYVTIRLRVKNFTAFPDLPRQVFRMTRSISFIKNHLDRAAHWLIRPQQMRNLPLTSVSVDL
jgi:hypothetical protein